MKTQLLQNISLKKALYIKAHDKTIRNYLGLVFLLEVRLIMLLKANKVIEKIFSNNYCKFIGFDSFEGFDKIKDKDFHLVFTNEIFSVNQDKVIKY